MSIKVYMVLTFEKHSKLIGAIPFYINRPFTRVFRHLNNEIVYAHFTHALVQSTSTQFYSRMRFLRGNWNWIGTCSNQTCSIYFEISISIIRFKLKNYSFSVVSSTNNDYLSWGNSFFCFENLQIGLTILKFGSGSHKAYIDYKSQHFTSPPLPG